MATDVIYLDSGTVVVETIEAPTVIETAGIGPQGPKGDKGDAGDTNLPGNLTGDILRWNATIEAWEATSEPFAFNQIILTPAETAALNAEGGLWYKSTDKSVYVCTNDT